MSLSSKVQVESHVKMRVDREKQAAKEHVDATLGALRTEVDAVGNAVGELVSLRPVQAGVKLVEGTVDAIKGLLVGNLDATLDNIKDQAALTRQGRA